jgi:hypothetical protein
MKEYIELEHVVDWLSMHSDEQPPEGFPKIYDRYEAIQILRWVMDDILQVSKKEVPTYEKGGTCVRCGTDSDSDGPCLVCNPVNSDIRRQLEARGYGSGRKRE